MVPKELRRQLIMDELRRPRSIMGEFIEQAMNDIAREVAIKMDEHIRRSLLCPPDVKRSSKG